MNGESRIRGFSVVGIVSVCLIGCAIETQQNAGDGPLEQTTEEAVGSNPSFDVEFWGELPSSTAISYKDIAVSDSRIFVLRSDGVVRNGPRSNPISLPAALQGTYDAIKWVPGPGDWNLIAARDDRKEIGANLFGPSSQHRVLGGYPAGVLRIGDITAVGSPSTLDLYVIHGMVGAPVPVLRHGRYSTSTGTIAWDANTIGWSLNQIGLCVGPHPTTSANALFSVVNYTRSFFSWWSLQSIGASSSELGFSTFTEHAYTHNEGVSDRFAPAGLDYLPLDGYFYGIDRYVGLSNRVGWVVARMHRSKIKP